MIARVATFDGTPIQLDEAMRVIRDEVHPRNAETPGYREGIFLVDRASGSGLLISLWHDEESIERAEERSKQAGQVGALEASGGQRSSVRLYEVASLVRGVE